MKHNARSPLFQGVSFTAIPGVLLFGGNYAAESLSVSSTVNPRFSRRLIR
jgi:hypothetical protein